MSKISYSSKLIFKSKGDELSVLELLEWQRLAFNESSKIIFGLTQKSIVDLHSRFYKDFRSRYPQIPSQVVICSERESLAKYKSAKSNKHKINSPIQKKNLSIQLDKRIYSVKRNGTISIISSNGRVFVEPKMYDRLCEFWGKYKICDPSIFVRDGEIWMNLIFDIPDISSAKSSVLGVDIGIRNFLVTSDGRVFDDKSFKKSKRSLRFLKRKLQSKGTKSAKRHLKKLRKKERHKNNNFCYKISKSLLENTTQDTLAFENLKGIKIKKNKYQNKNSISQVPIANFIRIISYKAPIYGKTVELVDPRNTSKTDCRTGKMDGERKGRRYYGKDGVVLDSDWNAAINIAKRTQLPVSFEAPLDGALKTGGQAQVIVPIVNIVNPKVDFFTSF